MTDIAFLIFIVLACLVGAAVGYPIMWVLENIGGKQINLPKVGCGIVLIIFITVYLVVGIMRLIGLM